MPKQMLKTALFLFIVSSVSGLLLALTEQITAPAIIAINEKIEMQARSQVLPQAKTFKTENQLTIGYKEDNSLAGFVIAVKPKGYAAELNMLVGISLNGKITGTKILAHSETPGLGAKITGEEFHNKFMKSIEKNEKPNFKVTKDGGDIDAITAATITSRAFCDGINEAKKIYDENALKFITSAGGKS